MFKTLLAFAFLLLTVASVRAQDSLAIAFQPLTLKCLTGWKGQEKSWIIRSQIEFEKLYHSFQLISTGRSDCKEPLPVIDFSQKSLLVFANLGTGCRPPDFEQSFLYLPASQQLLYLMRIYQYGNCKTAFSRIHFIVVPRLEQGMQLSFAEQTFRKK
jgi:hypothetical protein